MKSIGSDTISVLYMYMYKDVYVHFLVFPFVYSHRLVLYYIFLILQTKVFTNIGICVQDSEFIRSFRRGRCITILGVLNILFKISNSIQCKKPPLWNKFSSVVSL